jgi:hypothetical protein
MYYSDTQVSVPVDQLATHHCSGVGSLGGWKCPCCDVVSPTASAAQRHMDSHSGVKAFRCTNCRYKGNTLRGMRTHIRMHFEKRSTDLQVGIRMQYENVFVKPCVHRVLNHRSMFAYA